MFALASRSLYRLCYHMPKVIFLTKKQLPKTVGTLLLQPNGLYNQMDYVRYYRRASATPPISQTNPELLLLWHPTKNVGLSPDNISLKSFQKVWWKCPKGVDHEWQCSVRYIVNQDNKYVGCPFCNNKMVSITNSLSTKYPELAAQWHPTKNGSLLPSSVTYTSSKNVWWQCDKNPNHVWRKPVSQRVNPKTKTQGLCPYCSGIHPDSRSLEAVYPEIAKEWNYEKNGDLLPSQISKSSAVRVWWKCSKGHEWQTSVNNRTSSHHSGCPYCKGHSISIEHSLAYLYPEIASQWHPTKNGTLTPSQVFPCSDRVVWWVCTVPSRISPYHDDVMEILKTDQEEEEEEEKSKDIQGCGKEWEESIVNRVTKFKSNHTLVCPDCSYHRRSKNSPNKTRLAKKVHPSKKLKKLRVVDGKNKDEVIMVSLADYEMLIHSGTYEAIEDDNDMNDKKKKQHKKEDENNMKKVFGKKESPYKRHMNDTVVNGPRQRVIVKDYDEKNNDWLDEDSVFDDIANTGDVETYLHPTTTNVSEDDGKEDGWSF